MHQSGETFAETLLPLGLQRVIVGIAACGFSRPHVGAVEMRHRAEQTEPLHRPAAELRARVGDLAEEGIRDLRLQRRTTQCPVLLGERRERWNCLELRVVSWQLNRFFIMDFVVVVYSVLSSASVD